MPSLPTHLIVGAALGQGGAKTSRENWGFWLAALACSAIPDLDVLGFRFGIHYGDVWGHRGLTHSLLFAAMIGVATGLLLGGSRWERLRNCVLLILITASHGILDAMTNGGLGVAFFSPFDVRRYFLPWRPIQVSPIAIGRFATGGLKILINESKFVWLPAIAMGLALIALRRMRREPLQVDSGE